MGLLRQRGLAGRLFIPLFSLLLLPKNAHEGAVADSFVLYRIGRGSANFFDVDAVGDGRFAVLWIHFDTCFRSLRKDDLSKYQGGLRWCLQCLLQERRYKS